LSTQSPVYVDVGATGTSWANPCTDLQSSLDSIGITEIWIAAGTYKPSVYPAGCTGCATNRDFTFLLKDGVSLYDRFAGTEALLSERDIAMNPTILSDDIGTPSNASDNVHHVVLIVFADTISTTRLDGFTIIGGNADSSSAITVNGENLYRSQDGGINTEGGTGTLTNNIIRGNSSGIKNSTSSPSALTVTYSIVQQDSGGYLGTGNSNVDPLFVDQPTEGLGTSGDLRLQACSPTIDAGTDAGAPVDDLAGNARPSDAAANVAADFDMGAYEYQSLIAFIATTTDQTIVLNDGNFSQTLTATDFVTATDNCGDSTAIVFDRGLIFNSGDIRTFTQVVKVGDTTAPTFRGLNVATDADDTLIYGTNAGNTCVAYIRLDDVSVVDSCPGTVSISAQVFPDGNLAGTPIGTFAVVPGGPPELGSA
jgi:hypothetical protein